MLNMNPEIICLLIDKVRGFQVQEEVVIPEEADSPAEDWARQALAAHASDLTYLEAKSVIDDLEPDQQITLVALMWLGRGDYDLSDWDTVVADAVVAHNNYTAEYLLATPLMPSYLEEGLSLHGHSCQQERDFGNFGMRS
mgnify:CR=1 FL=1